MLSSLPAAWPSAPRRPTVVQARSDHLRNGLVQVALALCALTGTLAAQAQVPPSAVELLAYDGLFEAAHAGNVDSLQRALKRGAPVDARDARGRTPLHVATHARQGAAIRALVAAGADINALEADRYDAVTIASVADDVPTLALLLSLGARAGQITSRYDGTALIAAAHLGHDVIVQRLIGAGAPLDHVNNLHWTAAIEAVVLGDGGPRHQRTLAALIAAGANLRLADRQGRTPLALARARGYGEMVRMLEVAQR
ncbi:MAG: ankyrin repeat domain-containing protein [Comamonadaceae bacterium]|nr:MAG: ankyrin repeat domain-containing protein [Comamonadaceae bacterium]